MADKGVWNSLKVHKGLSSSLQNEEIRTVDKPTRAHFLHAYMKSSLLTFQHANQGHLSQEILKFP